jgi:hypothetical protein
MAMAVVIPGQFRNRDVEKFGDHSAASPVYARRRFAVLLTLAIIVLVLFVGTGHVVANRGGAPASASMIRPATSAAVLPPAAAHLYVAQAGDTLWSIGQRFHGHVALADYVDALVEANGGTKIQVSQAIALP